MTRLDFSFDERVVGQYDALRGHPPEVAQTIGKSLYQAATQGRTAAGAPCILELGVGTGRIALPVADHGARVVGIDLSADMLATLARQLNPTTLDIQLVRGDITALPFQPQVFDAAMVTHVLHLVPNWSAVLARLGEVLKPGGALLLGRDWVDPASMAGQIRMAFRKAVMQHGFKTAAPAGGPALHQALLAIGAKPVATSADVAPEMVAAEWQAEISPEEVLAGIRSRDDAESWVLPDEILQPVCAELDKFVDAWPNKKAPQNILRRFLVAIYRTDDQA